MKKLFLLLVIVAIFLSGDIFAQIKVANATKELIVVDDVSVPSRSVKEIDLLIKNGVASMKVSHYEGLELKGPEILLREVDKRGRVVIRDFNKASAEVKSRFNKSSASQKTTPPPSPNYSASSSPTDWWSTVTVRPENKLEDYSIFVPADPFKGLALKPGQESAKTATLKTGEIIFPVFLAAEDENRTKTGISFSWALVNKIVTEGQEVFEFLPEDIMKANSGEIVRKTLVSKLPFDFIISEGKSRGTVIPANYRQKLELYLGWNIIPIQYKDSKGLPTQAILILMVNDLRRGLLAKSKQGVDQVSVGRDNIVVTNYSR